jgi:hypothetical protein
MRGSRLADLADLAVPGLTFRWRALMFRRNIKPFKEA